MLSDTGKILWNYTLKSTNFSPIPQSVVKWVCHSLTESPSPVSTVTYNYSFISLEIEKGVTPKIWSFQQTKKTRKKLITWRTIKVNGSYAFFKSWFTLGKGLLGFWISPPGGALNALQTSIKKLVQSKKWELCPSPFPGFYYKFSRHLSDFSRFNRTWK